MHLVCYLQRLKEQFLVLFGFDNLRNRGQVFWLLKDMPHKDIQVLALARGVFLKLIRRAVANGWVAKKWRRAQLHIFVQFCLLLFEIQAKALLLFLAMLKLSEVDSEVVLLELMLTPKPELVELLHVVTPLFLDEIVRFLDVRRMHYFAVLVDE